MKSSRHWLQCHCAVRTAHAKSLFPRALLSHGPGVSTGQRSSPTRRIDGNTSFGKVEELNNRKLYLSVPAGVRPRECSLSNFNFLTWARSLTPRALTFLSLAENSLILLLSLPLAWDPQRNGACARSLAFSKKTFTEFSVRVFLP